MATAILREFGRQVWRLVRAQHGVVSRAQLLALGMSPEAIRHRLANGRLHKLWPGVYAVGRPEVTREGWWMAAVLACGERAALGFSSAAALWGIGEYGTGRIEVIVPGEVARRRQGIRIRRRKGLGGDDVCVHRGIRVTTPIATLIDLATWLSPADLETAVNSADRLVTPEALRAALDELPHRRGAPALRRLLDARTFRLTDSVLERRFLPLVAAAGLPIPLTQQRVNGFRVDFHWPQLNLVVETDGLRYHRTAAQQATDRRRDQAHTAAGTTHLRFTHAQVAYESDEVVATLRRTADRCRQYNS